mmetsp:Transcript_41059/g.30199  ORF Transcript_41059/g.30199 Transcript_41059/m.30199 type:complete len:86 (-) Transcript_41059:536-793(-)
MYRRMSNKALKDFNLQVYLHKDSLRVQVEGDWLRISFKVDASVNCVIRVNACVNEQRDQNNVPTMLYTPNKDDYVINMSLKAGLG